MIKTKMAVFRGPGQPFEFVERPVEFELDSGQCLVEILLATICGSDLHTVDGRRHELVPCVLGHEGVGRVVAAGLDRNPALIGRRVTWTLADSCGVCQPCRNWSLPQKCERLFKYGHAPLNDGAGFNGTYASHVVLRAGTTLFPLPETVTDQMAAPANCALATMVAATEPLSAGGETAVIQGAGLLGLFACALLRDKGWRRVVVVDTNSGRLELVPAFGGEPALNSARDHVAAGTVDAVVEATGHAAVIAEGIELLRPGGRYQLVGLVHPDSRLELTGEKIIRKCLTLQGTHNYAPRHLGEAVEFLKNRGRSLPWDRLVSPPLPLESIEEAMSIARSGQWPRVAVRPSPGASAER
ncbi:MAG TPA: zinc-binding dehydrogenase [Verrucomicrobiae bacterium]|jgi:putative phosphonate catabolism associated alcohol dehydrogenase|nr:zinc-binding dehydrogenase [Verrucomicrobiae bacterium]